MLLVAQSSGTHHKSHADMHLSSFHDASLHKFSLGPQAKRLLEAIIAKDKKGLLVRLTPVVNSNLLHRKI